MRQKMLHLLLFLPFTGFAQELPVQDGKIIYTDVLQVEGSAAADLFARAKRWYVKEYRNANEVIQMEDPERGEIIGKGIFKVVYFSRQPNIRHTVTIQVKDGRYRYEISNFSYRDIQGDAFALENFPRSWAGKRKLQERVDAEVQKLIASIKEAMSNKSDNEDW